MKQLRSTIGCLLLCCVMQGCATKSATNFTAQEAELSASMKNSRFYSQVPPDIDEISVTHPCGGLTIYTIKGTNLFNELNALLTFRPIEKVIPHECLGIADIVFKREDEERGRWNYAHGSFFASSGGEVTPDVDRKLADWFACHGVTEFRDWLGTDGGGFPGPRTFYEKGFNYLLSQQNGNGSWGYGSGSVFDTSFALTMFLHYGETVVSEHYGAAIEKSLVWLSQQNTTNNLDLVSAALATGMAYRMMQVPGIKDMVEKFYNAVDTSKLNEVEMVLFKLAPPLDKAGPAYGDASKTLHEYVAGTPATNQIALYLATLDKNLAGTIRPDASASKAVRALIRSQNPDGSFGDPAEMKRTVTTIFTLLRLAVPYRYWKKYLAVDADQ